ncbi:BREX-2 system phosphatase PglZ [Glycomyces salinus]|uniref:BREX-2 system phosphatase PglZ n=1 Tax=Glycomyces salinus TaxID=980294 RepID=UPI0018ED1D02|nr:BREX-2 system phosphatase PglZ [Glycomyces salinus]
MAASNAVRLPPASPGAVETAARRALRETKPGAPQVTVLRAEPTWDGTEPLEIDGRSVEVCPAATVLAVLDLIDRHEGPNHLVIPTGVDEAALGDSVLAQISGHRIESVDSLEAIRTATRADRIDVQLRGKANAWIAEQLLTYATELWPGRGDRRPSLSRLDTLRRLTAFHLFADPGKTVDTAAMLDWSRQAPRIRQWLDLDPALRANLRSAIVETAGDAAAIVTALAEVGTAAEALPVAVTASVLLDSPDGRTPLVRLEERYFGRDAPGEGALRRFAEAGVAYLERREGDDETVYAKAQEILADLGAASVAVDSALLGDGFDSRLKKFGKAVAAAVGKPAKLADAERAWHELESHRLADDNRERMTAAQAALRLLWWLDAPEKHPATLAAWVNWQVREGGWVDQAAAVLEVADTGGEAGLGRAYRSVLEQVRARRAAADAEFARKLASDDPTGSSEMLLAENLQARLLRPLDQAKRELPPLIIVCDGMSAADAAAIGADIQATGTWIEAGRTGSGREGALATIPSSTIYSRTSLLSGGPATGGQDAEARGFARYWHRRKTRLFHKGDLRAATASQIPAELHSALADRETLVGVVLNTIDDALDKDDLISRPVWSLDSVDYLAPLLAAASRASRPVLLCSDHGHVRDRGTPKPTRKGESARWRSGSDAGEGEIVLDNSRVLTGSPVVAAVDRGLRYTARKAGYHGGASLAEMVIPVLAFIPSRAAKPAGWEVFDRPAMHEPAWWNGRITAIPEPKRDRKRAEPAGATLFGDATIGQSVCATELYRSIRARTPRALEDAKVAAVIDALHDSGGRLPAARVAEIAGKQASLVGGFLAMLKRLLNVDGYAVISEIDKGRTITLDRELLTQQFGVGAR